MTNHTARSELMKRLWIPALALASAANACSSEATGPSSSDQPSSEVEKSSRSFRFCGGQFTSRCLEDELCVPLFAGTCPGPMAVGFCTLRPTTCDSSRALVCGCDDQTYENWCEAAKAGVTAEFDGACPVHEEPACADVTCPGAGACVEPASEDCDVDGDGDCEPTCDCSIIGQCPQGQHWNDDPGVCACEAQAPDPCVGIICPTGSECVPRNGTPVCE